MKKEHSENRELTTLRHRLLLMVMIFVSIIITGLLVFVNFWSFLTNRQLAHNHLRAVAYNETNPEDPEFVFVKTPYETSQVISIEIARDGSIASWDSNVISDIEESRIEELLRGAQKKNRIFGSYRGFYFYKGTEIEKANNRIYLMDNSVGSSYTRRVVATSTSAGIITAIVCFILGRMLIYAITLPVREMLEKQQQFITDAEHELKTPIAVISANANVLSNEIGDNKWLNYIIDETHRMESLVKGLMDLVHSERIPNTEDYVEFDFSNALYGVVLPMESLAYEHQILLDMDIDSDIIFWGNEAQLAQLATILMTNAITYGETNGLMSVSLHAQPLRRTVTLSVYNTGVGIAPEDIDKIFDRFFRSDLARKRSGNHYGLGLSIAKAIVDQHQGHIEVRSDYGKFVEFQIVLPIRKNPK